MTEMRGAASLPSRPTLPLLFRDTFLAVAVKPVGLLSQESPRERNLPALLREQIGASFVGAVQRLDRDVGGVTVLSLDRGTAGKLSSSLTDKAVCVKEYLALLSGIPEKREGVLSDLLFHDVRRNKTFVVDRMRKGVKEASLAYEVLATGNGRALVLVRLHTGRTHQIRVQFSSRGLPLIGDRSYGGARAEADQMQEFENVTRVPIESDKIQGLAEKRRGSVESKKTHEAESGRRGDTETGQMQKLENGNRVPAKADQIQESGDERMVRVESSPMLTRNTPALWSYRLTFPHPVTGERLTFSSLPEGGTLGGFRLPDFLTKGKENFMKTVDVSAALIFEGGKFLIAKRPPQKARGLLWEFVGGKVEPGETGEEALIRECREELAVTVRPRDIFLTVLHEYPDITVRLTLYRADIAVGRPQALEHVELRWISPSEIGDYDFCPADRDILKKLSEEGAPEDGASAPE